MSKTQEALKLALEALKQIDEAMPFPVAKLAQKAIREALAEQPAQPSKPVPQKLLEAKQNFERNFGPHAMADWIYSDLLEWLDDTSPQPAQEEPSVHAISGRTADELWLETGRLRSELADLKAQQQEPLTGGDERRHIICLCPDCTKPAPATELREQQEPVAKVDYKQRDGFRWLNYLGWQRIPDGASLYTSPPASKPLTKEQIERIYETPEIAGSCFENATDKAIALARAIEAAHGITKGNT